MSDPIQAYPLQWPPGWRRIDPSDRRDHQFKHYGERLTIPGAVGRLLNELRKLGVDEREVVISTNVRPTLAGLPSTRERGSDDPGVAVYWHVGRQRRCIATDRYQTVVGNLGAIAATLEAMRAIERHGGAEILDRAFTGFVALPAPEQWFTVLGVGANATRAEIEEAYRRLAMTHHPDRGGGFGEMARINVARDEGLERAPA